MSGTALNTKPEGFEVLVVEDHPLMANSITTSLQTLQSASSVLVRVMVATSLAQAKKRLLRRIQPRLVITDLNLPDSVGLDTLRALRVAAAKIPIVVFSVVDDKATEQAVLDQGAEAFISKSSLPQSFVQKIKPYFAAFDSFRSPGNSASGHGVAVAVTHPLSLLTERQRVVLAEVANGYSNREIALRLKIGEQTVHTHLTDVFQRMGVQNRTQASLQYVSWITEHGVLA